MTASGLAACVGVDVPTGVYMYQVEQMLGGMRNCMNQHGQMDATTRQVPTLVNAKRRLGALGVHAVFPTLLSRVRTVQTQEDVRELYASAERLLIRDNAVLLNAADDLATEVSTRHPNQAVDQQMALAASCVQGLARAARTALVERGQMDAADRLLERARSSGSGLTFERAERLVQMVLELRALVESVLGQARCQYGIASEAACIELWNQTHDSSEQMEQPMRNVEHRPIPGVVITGRPDARIGVDGELVEIKFRVDKFLPEGSPRWSETLQMHAYMAACNAQRCMLLEGVRVNGMIVLKQRWVAFDDTLWNGILETLKGTQHFSAQLQSHELFHEAFHSLSAEAKYKMFCAHVPQIDIMKK